MKLQPSSLPFSPHQPDPRQIDIEEWLRMDRTIITIDRPIDPREMGDDGEDVTIEVGDLGGGDPSRVVHDVTADPRGPAHAGQPIDTGPQVLTYKPGTPLAVAGTQQVRQLKTPPTQEEQDLAKFVRSLDMDPTEMGLQEAPEPQPEARQAASPVPQRQAPPQGDHLERARITALRVLALLPPGCELFVGGDGTGAAGVELAMGLGLLIGKGHAVYRGDGHYRLSDAGREASKKEGWGA